MELQQLHKRISVIKAQYNEKPKCITVDIFLAVQLSLSLGGQLTLEILNFLSNF